MIKILYALLLLLSAGLPAFSQGQTLKPLPEILVLGTYHMENPGRDMFNIQSDDVLSVRRQNEIRQVITLLKKFRPTKIAIESDILSRTRTGQYSAYLDGTHSLSQNEIEQLGFRLAKELDHRSIYPVDVDGEFPMERVANFAKSRGRAELFETLIAQVGTRVKSQSEYLKDHTILEMLKKMNSDEMVRQDIHLYYELLRFGDQNDYAGADLLAAWYKRNVRIYQNIVNLVESRDERILVIYGAGHLGWLRQSISNDPNARLRKMSDL